MFSTDQDVFDSREVVERIAELEALQDDNELTEEDGTELDMLTAFAKEGSVELEDWEYGVTFIREDYFVAYTEEMLKETGYFTGDLPWWIVIDWDATADHVKEDYTEFTLDGNTYYAR